MKNFERVRAKLGRDDNGYAYCDIESTNGRFILMMVSADKADTEADVVQTALRCLSSSDLVAAKQEAA